MASAFSKIKRESKCSAEEEVGKPMGSQEDTPTTKATPFTLWLMVTSLEWAPTSFTLSRDKRSITAPRVRKVKPFTRLIAMESKASNLLRPPNSMKGFMNLMERQLLSRTTKWSTKSTLW